MITSMSMKSKCQSATPIAAHLTIAARATRLITCMGPDAATKQCRMETTLIIWSTATCIIPMATTAMTMAR